MKITYKGDYALKILLDLALNYGRGLIQVKDISKRQDIPLKYLGQIILTLKSAGYIISKRGHDGGVLLAKPPEKITLGEVVRITDGTTSPITCVSCSEPTKCDFSRTCPFMPVWAEVRQSINRIVDSTTMLDMVNKYKASTVSAIDYAI